MLHLKIIEIYSFLNLGARWGWVVKTTPRPLYPRERPGAHCIGVWMGLRVDLNGCEKNSPPPGFDHRTVKPVACRYTDYAIVRKVSNKTMYTHVVK
jgi:hypothetical protein